MDMVLCSFMAGQCGAYQRQVCEECEPSVQSAYLLLVSGHCVLECEAMHL